MVSVPRKGEGNMHMTLRCGKPNDRKHSLLTLLKLSVSTLGECFHFIIISVIIDSFLGAKAQNKMKSQIDIRNRNFRHETETTLYFERLTLRRGH